MAKLTILPILSLTLLLCTLPISGAPTVESLPATAGYLPAGRVEYRPINSTRRELVPFQQCNNCMCCKTKDRRTCSSMPCCFRIDCNLPHKPFGTCAFVPKTCNCTSCV